MERLTPTLVVFSIHWAGLVLGGLLGPVLAVALLLALTLLATGILVGTGRRPDHSFWVLVALIATGPLSLAIRPSPRVPSAGLPGPEEPVLAEVTVRKVLRWDPQATEALVRVDRLVDRSGRAVLPEDGLVALRGPGGLDLWRSRTLVLRAHWDPPPPPSEAIGPRWPDPPSRPRLRAPYHPPPVGVRRPGQPDIGIWDRVRHGLDSRLVRGLEDREASLVRAVLLGEGGAVPGDLRADLADLGTAHILCVSGLHVTAAAWIAGVLVTRILGPLLVRRRPQTDLIAIERGSSLLAATALAALADFPVSAVRAVGMFSVATLGTSLGRPTTLAGSLGLTGLVDLVLRPVDAFDLSFALSYGALLGLVLLGSRERRSHEVSTWYANLGNRVRAGFRASLAATLGTAPWTLLFFGQASLVAPLTNVVVLPVFSLIVMPAVLLHLLLTALVPALASLWVPLLQGLLAVFLDAQAWAGSLVPALRHPSPGLLLASFGLMGLAWAALLGLPRRRWWLPTFLGVSVGASAPMGDIPPSGSLILEVLPVGKGDALLVRCPDGDRWLVDTGEARTADTLLRHLRNRGIRSLEGLVLTHADEDHVGGASSLLSRRMVREVRAPCPVIADPPLRTTLEAHPEVPVRCLVAGQEVIPTCGEPSIAIWPPPGEDLHGNAASLVFSLGLAGRTILLTGDLEEAEEVRLLEAGKVPRADVLKLGHHGSPGSSSEAFLEAVAPRFALVSGYRTRRHRDPSPETRRRVESLGATWLDSLPSGGLRVTLTPDGQVLAGGRRTPGPWRH